MALFPSGARMLLAGLLRRMTAFPDAALRCRDIGVDVGWPVDDVLRTLAVQTGTSPRIVHRINDFSVTEDLVAAGVGIALLPRYSTDDRGGRRLARRPVAGVRRGGAAHEHGTASRGGGGPGRAARRGRLPHPGAGLITS
jgi:DNA-binding transcriptional LysR family regulator